MGPPRGNPAAQLPLIRVPHPETMDMVAMRDSQQLPALSGLPEASIEQNAGLSPGQSRIPRLRVRRGNVHRPTVPDMSGVTADFLDPRPRPAASSQATVVLPRATTGPAAPTPADGIDMSDIFNGPPSPGGVWATNASNFAGESNPQIRFVTDMPNSEPRLNRDKGKGVDKRHHTEPFAGGKDCGCVECDAQKKGLLSSEMIYAYLAMRGVQSGEGLFENLMAKYRKKGKGQMVPVCPHARSKMKKEQEAASKREGKRSGAIANIFLPAEDFSAPGPSAAGRVNAGPSTAGRANAGPSTAPRFNTGPPPTVRSPSVAATLNTTPSFVGLTNISLPNSVNTFVSDFNLDDVSDDGDVAKGAITPNDFLRFASGAATTQADKPLPPLPLNPGESSRAQVQNENEHENGSGNSNAIESETVHSTEFRDRVEELGFHNQICEETMEVLTGSYSVSSNPSVLNEPPGVRHLGRLRGAFGTLFSRMQPGLGERLDRIRLGLAQESGSSLSIFSDSQYTDNEMAAALTSRSATAINGIPPAQVEASLAEAEHTVGHIENLEAAAHRRAVDASQRLDFLRNTLGRITAGADYIAHRRDSSRRAKIRRSVGHRLRGLEYRRERAMDGLIVEEARRARDAEAIREAEDSIERVLGTVDHASVEEVLGEASRLWIEVNRQE